MLLDLQSIREEKKEEEKEVLTRSELISQSFCLLSSPDRLSALCKSGFFSFRVLSAIIGILFFPYITVSIIRLTLMEKLRLEGSNSSSIQEEVK
jgi:hypothetical protein